MATVSKRAWVKNAAIIFLAVMLVLTFFSNTIMNHALPEVAAQYAQSGTITSKVRATSEVKANMTFNVVADQSREVDSVAVKVGDSVEAGGVLYYLKDEESQELKEAQKTLDDMELAYEKALLSLPVPDYSSDELSIRIMREDLAKLLEEKSSITENDAKVKSAKAAVNAAQDRVDALTDQQTDLTEEISSLADGSSALKNYKASLDNATKTLEQAKKELERANTALQSSGGSSADLESAQMAVNAKARIVEDAQLTLDRSVKDAEIHLAQLQKAVTDANNALNLLPSEPALDSEEHIVWEANKAAAEQALAEANQALEAGQLSDQRLIEDNQIALSRAQEELFAAQSALAEVQAKAVQQQALQSAADAAQANVDRCQADVDAAQQSYDIALEQTSASLKGQLDTIKSQLKAAQRALSDAQDALTEAQANAGTTPDAADDAILAKQREIESAQQALAAKKEADLVEAKKDDLDIQAQEKQLEAQRALVEKYKSQGTGATITSQYSGIVSSLSAVAGDTISTGSTVAVVEVVEKGYSMEFAVTNDQAKLIKVGDQASINSWWYSDVTVTVAQMKNDPANPGKGRIVVCDVRSDSEGGVTVGQSLSIVLGERGATYEIVVPNSAIREDSNGKFVLVVESKSSPLGNRYIATRADITVVASDDNSSAIQGALYGNEFVITTSTKPIEAGQQVRLVEN